MNFFKIATKMKDQKQESVFFSMNISVILPPDRFISKNKFQLENFTEYSYA